MKGKGPPPYLAADSELLCAFEPLLIEETSCYVQS